MSNMCSIRNKYIKRFICIKHNKRTKQNMDHIRADRSFRAAEERKQPRN